jgi:hypothetical protein
MLPHGSIFFVELKAASMTPTPLQKLEHNRMRRLGQAVHVIDSKQKVDDLLAQYREIINKKKQDNAKI